MDLNQSVSGGAGKPAVEAYTASWIEIFKVDNVKKESPVEAYTASWIEMMDLFD